MRSLAACCALFAIFAQRVVHIVRTNSALQVVVHWLCALMVSLMCVVTVNAHLMRINGAQQCTIVHNNCITGYNAVFLRC